MSLRADILPVLDFTRALLDDPSLSLRRFSVTLRVTTWSGVRVGLGTATIVDTPLTVLNGARPKVALIKSQEVISGGGKYQDGDFKVGPFTPKYVGGGVNIRDLDPETSGKAEVSYHLVSDTGEDFWCSKIDSTFDQNFRYMLTLRRVNTSSGI